MDVLHKKEIFVDDKHYYNVSAEKTKKGMLHSLYYSSDEEWTHPNTLIMSLLDDGNKVKISKFRKADQLDFDEVLELSILLRAYFSERDYTIEMVEQKINL